MAATTARDDPAERVRERIERWLELTGLTHQEFADEMGHSKEWVQKILSRQNKVRLQDIDKIAALMRLTASELVRNGESERYQMDLAPTEVRLVEKLRRTPHGMESLAYLLKLNETLDIKTERADTKRDSPSKRIARKAEKMRT
jgi:transcriptional regulator with XRE-family HTH domain